MSRRRAALRGPSWGRFVSAALVGVLVSVGTVTTAAPAVANPSEFTFNGRGWGHGRGMGQFGALGYAVNHGWSTEQILAHFYGGTHLATDAGNPMMSVELEGLTGREVVLTAPVILANGQPTNANTVRAIRNGAGQIEWFAGSGCGPGTGWRRLGAGPSVRFSTPPDVVNAAQMLGRCDDGTIYRGLIDVVSRNNTSFAINHLATEHYLLGVLPREMPAGWADHGGGRGMQALRAGAVAARSFALSGVGSPRASGAITCDTTNCQVYRGIGQRTPTGTIAMREDSRSNAAVNSTSGWVMRRNVNGAIARTEYSSSTGGWSAGGVFPAVRDDGDSIAANPNHTWTLTLSAADLGTRLGLGPITSVEVTARNGLGADGGRATQVIARSGNNSRTFTGQQFRMAAGLRSDWFTVAGSRPPTMSPREADAVVRALYRDLLGRDVDPSGLATWTNHLAAGNSQADLVNELTRSLEFTRLRVDRAYRDVLRRAPDAAGFAHWVSEIQAGRVTVDDVAMHFFHSQEFFLQGGGTLDGFIRHLYRVMLGRDAAQAEVSWWAQHASTHGRPAAVQGIFLSPEAAGHRVHSYFQLFLGRRADASGVATWSNVMLQQSQGAVRIGIAGSAEYRSRAVARFP